LPGATGTGVAGISRASAGPPLAASAQSLTRLGTRRLAPMHRSTAAGHLERMPGAASVPVSRAGQIGLNDDCAEPRRPPPRGVEALDAGALPMRRATLLDPVLLQGSTSRVRARVVRACPRSPGWPPDAALLRSSAWATRERKPPPIRISDGELVRGRPGGTAVHGKAFVVDLGRSPSWDSYRSSARARSQDRAGSGHGHAGYCPAWPGWHQSGRGKIGAHPRHGPDCQRG
jgi:hypothetical protein